MNNHDEEAEDFGTSNHLDVNTETGTSQNTTPASQSSTPTPQSSLRNDVHMEDGASDESVANKEKAT